MKAEQHNIWVSRLKPGVGKDVLVLLAGLMWSGVGVFLCSLAYRWLRDANSQSGIIFALAGILLSTAIYRFGFLFFANRNLERIRAYEQNRICIFAFQAWTSYPLVAVMITMGIGLRKYSPIPKPWLAILYIGIGAGLFWASLHYYVDLYRSWRKGRSPV